ncbi:isochorismatase family protein [bacterium]|nr:isochorismatase family protein [bacterium]
MRTNMLARESALVVLIDFQEKLVRVMSARETVEDRIGRLVKAAGILEVPIIVTEQYPAGLGRTTAGLIGAMAPYNYYEPVEKIAFSCFGEPSFLERLATHQGRPQLVLVGIESHVCVLQTAFDARDKGFEVFIAADAVCSRSEKDYHIALERMKLNGITIVTFEMVAFEWLRRTDLPEFRAVHKLIV